MFKLGLNSALVRYIVTWPFYSNNKLKLGLKLRRVSAILLQILKWRKIMWS